MQFTSDAFTSLLRDDLDNIHAFEIVQTLDSTAQNRPLHLETQA